MSLADYTGLKAEVGDWLHRSDITSQVDTFVDLFESEFNANVRVRQMEQRTQITSTAGYLTHPTNWLGWKGIKGTVGNDVYYLQPASDEIVIEYTGTEASTDTPRYYKVEGTRTYLYPPATGVALTCIYHEGVGLSSGTNWLLTSHPQAYLFGALLHSHLYTVNDERVSLWRSAFDNAITSIKNDSKRAEWSGQELQMKSDVRAV